ncbi:hypothetical protein BD309DRAFT_960844, partial [Dichomitus squalens]
MYTLFWVNALGNSESLRRRLVAISSACTFTVSALRLPQTTTSSTYVTGTIFVHGLRDRMDRMYGLLRKATICRSPPTMTRRSILQTRFYLANGQSLLTRSLIRSDRKHTKSSFARSPRGSKDRGYMKAWDNLSVNGSVCCSRSILPIADTLFTCTPCSAVRTRLLS